MADKDNIISLEDRLRRKEGAGGHRGEGSAAGESAAGKSTVHSSAEDAGAGDAPPEALSSRATSAKATSSEAMAPLPGRLVWLHCPACGTLQYTEVVMAGGRNHNVCGNQVEEMELEIDVRAEYTIAHINLERLGMLAEAVEAQKERHREYQERLRMIAGGNVAAYPVTEDTLKKLPVAEVDAMGMMVSSALHDPARHFGPADDGEEGAPARDPESPSPKPESP